MKRGKINTFKKLTALFLTFVMMLSALPALSVKVSADSTSSRTGGGNELITYTKTAKWCDDTHKDNNFDADMSLDFTGYSLEVKQNPVDIIVILDNSSSMKGNPAAACQKGAQTFCKKYLEKFPSATIAVTAFNDKAQEADAPYYTFTNNYDILSNTIYSTYKDGAGYGSGTNYEAGFISAKNIMQKAGKKYTDIAIVFFSDGKPNHVCNNESLTSVSKPGFDTAIAAAHTAINKYFVGTVDGKTVKTPIFTMSYNVTNEQYLDAIKHLATEEVYFFNSANYDGEVSEVFMSMFNAVLDKLFSVPVTFVDVVSKYWNIVDKSWPADDKDATYKVDQVTIEGETLDRITVDMRAGLEVDKATAKFKIRLKDEYKFVSENTTYVTNRDTDENYAASVTYKLLKNSVENGGGTLYCPTTRLDVPPTKVELTFNKTLYSRPRGEGLDSCPLDYTLKLNGQEFDRMDPKNEWIHKMIEFSFANYGDFRDIKGLQSGTIEWKEIEENGKKYNGWKFVAQKSCVSYLDASIFGTNATNRPVTIVPGDVNADGYVSVSDAMLVANVLRRTISADHDYIKELCDTNSDGYVTVADASIIASMVRGTTEYNNSYR